MIRCRAASQLSGQHWSLIIGTLVVPRVQLGNTGGFSETNRVSLQPNSPPAIRSLYLGVILRLPSWAEKQQILTSGIMWRGLCSLELHWLLYWEYVSKTLSAHHSRGLDICLCQTVSLQKLYLFTCISFFSFFFKVERTSLFHPLDHLLLYNRAEECHFIWVEFSYMDNVSTMIRSIWPDLIFHINVLTEQYLTGTTVLPERFLIHLKTQWCSEGTGQSF